MEATTMTEKNRKTPRRSSKLLTRLRNSIHRYRRSIASQDEGDSGHTNVDELDTALMQATVEGDLVRVQQFTSLGANRHVQHANNSAIELEHYTSYDRDAFDTPLEAAAWLGHVDIVRYLLSRSLQRRSSRRLLLARKQSSIRRNNLQVEQEQPTEVSLDHEAFLAACQGAILEVVQCFVQHFGSSIVRHEFSDVAPLHYACARCHLPMIQYLISQGARLDTRSKRGGATPVHWLGMFVEMKHIHGSSTETSLIPLPEYDDLTEESYEAALAWISQHYPPALFVPDNRGTTALQKLIHVRAPLGLIRTAVVQLLCKQSDV